MNDIFDHLMAELEKAFRRLEKQVPPPVKEACKDGFTLRYVEQTPQQAMLQKFARIISGLNSLRLLLASGFLQEMGVIQRTLDDFVEDILYITLAVVHEDMTERHKKFLEYHWMKESGEADVNRGQVPRKYIRAYVAKHSGADPSSMNSAGRIIYKLYSGFVHGNGQTTIDMCMNDPPRYFLNGMLKSPIYPDHRDDLWNYMYRGLVASKFMACLFDDEALLNHCNRSLKNFEMVYSNKIF